MRLEEVGWSDLGSICPSLDFLGGSKILCRELGFGALVAINWLSGMNG